MMLSTFFSKKSRHPRVILIGIELNSAILRERDRSDRTGIPFSLAVIKSNKRTSQQTEGVLQLLFDRIRVTDEIGVLDEQNLAILLTDTKSTSASKLGIELKEICEEELQNVVVEAMAYPFHEDSEPEEENTTKKAGYC